MNEQCCPFILYRMSSFFKPNIMCFLARWQENPYRITAGENWLKKWQIIKGTEKTTTTTNTSLTATKMHTHLHSHVYFRGQVQK